MDDSQLQKMNTYLVHVIEVSLRVEAVVHVIEHVDDLISWAVCCDVSERHNVAEENCAGFVSFCRTSNIVTFNDVAEENCAGFVSFCRTSNTVTITMSRNTTLQSLCCYVIH